MGIFSKPKTPDPPPVPPPPAVSQVGEEVADQAALAATRRRGISKTILAGLTTPSSGKSTLLG